MSYFAIERVLVRRFGDFGNEMMFNLDIGGEWEAVLGWQAGVLL
jgi:hypothetical protein